MTENLRTLVAIATYNEIENLPQLVAAIRQHVPDIDILVTDDNSPDGTGRILDELAARDDRIFPQHRPAKLGLGTAHIAGIKFALSRRFEPILTMDADFSHAPRFVPDMIAAMSTHDLVIGSRYVPGGGTLHCSAARKALDRAFYEMVSCMIRERSPAGAAARREHAKRVAELLTRFA